MFSQIKTKAKDCEAFAKECEKWKMNCERQLQHINHIMEQNDKMLKTCKDILQYDEKPMKVAKISRRLDYEVSQVTTPPTPIMELSESQNVMGLSLSPCLIQMNNDDENNIHNNDNDNNEGHDDDDDDDDENDSKYKTPIKKTKSVNIREDKNTVKQVNLSGDDHNPPNTLLNQLLNQEENTTKIKRKRQRIKK